MTIEKKKIGYYIVDLVVMLLIFYLICTNIRSLGIGLIISVVVYNFVTRPLVDKAFKLSYKV